ncbi:MAG: STAS domain-containing protein [Ignavibacteria bacterium]|nr:STAS domain-containing protein [Ignavibacteria bacterium]
MNLNFSLETKDEKTILSLYESKLDTIVSHYLKAELLVVCKEDKVQTLVLDLTDVQEADEHGLSALLFTKQLSEEYDFDLRLAGVNHDIIETMQAIMMDQSFAFYDSLEEAMEE